MNESWKLVILKGPEAGRSFDLKKDVPLLLGRGSQSDTQIRDPTLSRIHCELKMDGTNCVLTDRDSSTGTLFDGNFIEHPTVLVAGDQFQIGETTLQIRRNSPLDSATIVPSRLKPDQPLAIKPMTELVGETFHHYRLDRFVHQSVNSAIFKGHDTKRDRTVAIKILKPHIASDERQQERFIRAMKTMLPIRHPNIVRLYGAGRRRPYCWAALEWIDGVSVSELIESIGVSGMLDWKEVWRIAVHIARALEEASRQMIVHRNVTPSNIIRRAHDQSFLLSDLIFARALEQTEASQLTRPGDVIGELGYMPPERLLDATLLDERGDQYSLGATLYTLLTGEPPYSAIGIADFIQKLRTSDPKLPSQFQMGVHEPFSDIVMRMIHKSPDRRFSCMTTLLTELQRVGKHGGIDADWSDWR